MRTFYASLAALLLLGAAGCSPKTNFANLVPSQSHASKPMDAGGTGGPTSRSLDDNGSGGPVFSDSGGGGPVL